jgi:DNA-directed RNA polymerase subunit K/omega
MSDYEDNIYLDDEFDEEPEFDVEEDDENEDDNIYDVYETSESLNENNISIRNNFLNIYEITMLIGYRASQISNGSLTFLPDEKLAKKLANPLLIAEEEFKRGLIPFDIIRHINIGKKIKNVCLKIGGDDGLTILDVGNMF